MLSPWDILGLDDPTDDLRQIKKAYAKKLKTTRPDDDPVAFMALREALDMAQNHARFMQQADESDHEIEIIEASAASPSQDSPMPSPSEQSESPEESTKAAPITVTPISADNPGPLPPQDNVSSIMDDLHKLMKDPFGRTDTKRWTALFEDQRLEAIDDANDFEDAFLYYLLENFGYIDRDPAKHNSNRKPRPITSQVATHIFNQMGWRDSSNRPFYMQDQLSWLKRDLDVINRSRPHQNQTYQPPTMIEKTEGNSKWIPVAIFCLYLLYLIYNAVSNSS